MKQIFLFLMLCMPVFVFGEGLAPDSSMVDSTGTVHYDKLTKWYNRVYDRWESEVEASFTYPQHNLTPWFFFSGITVNPVGRLTVGASYVFFLGLYHPEGEKRYLTSTALAEAWVTVCSRPTTTGIYSKKTLSLSCVCAMPTAWVGDATLNTTYTTLISFFIINAISAFRTSQ